MTGPLPLIGRSQRVTCKKGTSELFILAAEISEGVDQLTTIEVEFLTETLDVDSTAFLADEFTIEMETRDGVRKWVGTCVECQFLGLSTGMGYGKYPHYKVKMMSWPWLLTRTRDCRIFQEKTGDDIIKEILNEAGFSDVKWTVSQTPVTREYCVQYRETDWDFIRRLLEEEGRFFYFDYSGGKDLLSICDDSAGLRPIEGEARIELIDKEAGQRSEIDYIDNWKDGYRVDTDKVTLDDYDFKKSKTGLSGTRQDQAQKYEIFDYPGRYLEAAEGTRFAKLRMESIIAGKNRIWGTGTAKALAPGSKFTLDKHPRADQNKEYLVLTAKHSLRMERTEEAGPMPNSGHFDPKKAIESQKIEFTGQDGSVAYVPVQTVPWPSVQGIQTAIVVGPSGEEIYTDEHGRIKVQFHWDRLGENNESSSCFIRVATPIAGKNWGMIHIPRIGQEVVVQFLEGDPDRPLVIGSVYNDFQTPPFALPDNKTQIGLVSDTHLQEDTKAKHEFVMEEKKDAEFIRMQSEKDYLQIIKNNADVKIGSEEKPDGDYTQSVWRDTTREYGVASGAGNLTETVQTDFTKAITDGNYKLDVETGERTTTVKKDDTLTVDGNIDTTTKKAATLTATNKITLKCGGSTIEMTPSKISIKSAQIEVKANAQLNAESPMTTVKGSGMLTLQGGLVKIN